MIVIDARQQELRLRLIVTGNLMMTNAILSGNATIKIEKDVEDLLTRHAGNSQLFRSTRKGKLATALQIPGFAKELKENGETGLLKVTTADKSRKLLSRIGCANRQQGLSL